MAVKRARQSCGMVMLLLQVDALVVVVFLGVVHVRVFAVMFVRL